MEIEAVEERCSGQAIDLVSASSGSEPVVHQRQAELIVDLCL